MMNLKSWAGALCFLMAGCTFDNEETLFAEISCRQPDQPVSYQMFVAPLLQRRCTSCHGQSLASGGLRLDNYSAVSVQVENGRLLGSIRHTPGFVPMPQGGAKLSDCDIGGIERWIENGYPEN